MLANFKNKPRVLLTSLFAISLISIGFYGCGGSSSGPTVTVTAATTATTPAVGVVIPPVVVPPCTSTTTGTAGAIVLPSMISVPSRFSGVAPLAVFFDASNTTTVPVSPRPFHDLDYRWNFGETALPGNGTWTTGSKPGVSSRNLASGPVSAHVYETPGTYTVSLTVSDGANSISNACVQIVVSDPDVVFAGTNTVCIGATSLPVAATGGCPAGAVAQMTADFAVGISFATTGKRVLFRRGDIWTAPGGAGVARISPDGPGIVGAFGAGASPLVRPALPAGNNMLEISGLRGTPNVKDWRIMDLEFDGQGTMRSNGVVGAAGAQQITLVRLKFYDIGKGILFSGQALDFPCTALCPLTGPLGEKGYDQIAIYNTDIQRSINPTGGGGMGLEATRLSLLGNFVNDTTAAEHPIRIQYASKAVIQSNDFGLPPNAKSVFTLRAINVGVGGVTSPGITEQAVISDNLFRGGLSSQIVHIRPSAATEDQRIRDIIFDGNFILGGSGAQDALITSADEITVRNNIINMTGGFNYNCMRFEQSGAEPAHSEIRVYNNTCFTNDPGTGITPPTLRFVTLDATNTNVSIKNNLGYAPNVISLPTLLLNPGSTGVIGASGTFGNSSNFQIRNTSPLFSNGSGTFSQASDYTVGAASYAVNNGVAVPVFFDFFRNSRPLGLSFDIGATER